MSGVRDLLTHRKRQNLADLLAEASIHFEYIDMGFSMQNDSVTALVNAAVYAPISAYDQLLDLSDEDDKLVWNAVADVWPYIEGDQAVLGRSFRLHTESFVNADDSNGFLGKAFDTPSLDELPVAASVSTIIQDRLDEVQLCFPQGAFLSVIFLCGSILEAVLLGAAERDPKLFNQSQSSPKQDGKVKRFDKWNLSEFIDVAHDIGLLEPDVKGFSHELRNFRNYIHPHKQVESGFKPDEYTATICLQVLKAALASVAGKR